MMQRLAQWRNLLDNALAVLRAKWFLRHCDAIGPRARVWGAPAIQNWGRMHFGGRLRLVSTIARSELVSGSDGLLEIGDDVFVNYGASIAAHKLVRIGDHCSLGTHAIIMDNDFHSVIDRNKIPPSEPVILGANVWLGARVIVLKGVTIGKNSVIGAGSVVTKDIPPDCLAAGVPARVIRQIQLSEVQGEQRA